MYAAYGKAFFSGLSAGTDKIAAKIHNRLETSRAETENKIRAANNAASKARGDLDRWIQSVNNQEILKAAGSQLAAESQNFERQMAAYVESTAARDIAAAESLGKAAAAQAFSGTGGSAADRINTATNLRAGFTDKAAERRMGYARYDYTSRLGAIASQAIGGLDSSVLMDSIDATRSVGRFKQEQSWLGTIATAFADIAGSGSLDAAMNNSTKGKEPAVKDTGVSGDSIRTSRFNYQMTDTYDVWSL